MSWKHFSITESRGIASLDLLRGLAAWFVTIPHYFLFLGYTSPYLEFSAIYAVEVFFALSGFVLGPQLDHCFKAASWGNLKVFYARRWMRTLPLFFIILCCIAAMYPNLDAYNFLSYSTFTTTWLYIPAEGEFFMPAWSLAVEEWFYLLFPLFLIVFSRLGLQKLYAIAAFIILLAVAKVIFVTMSTDTGETLRRVTAFRLDAIVYGYIAYLISTRFHDFSRSQVLVFWTVGAVFLLLCFSTFETTGGLLYTVFAAASAGMLVFAMRFSNSIFPEHNIFRKSAAFFAHTSYCVYLVHFLIFQIGQAWFAKWEAAGFVAYVVFILVVSTVSFYLIERPFLTIRPTYTAQQRPEKRFRESLPYHLVTNVLVGVTLLWLAEIGASGFKHLYQTYYVNRVLSDVGVKQPEKVRVGQAEMSLEERFQRDLALLNVIPGTPYNYASYQTYINRAFASDTINIGRDGFRITPIPNLQDQIREHNNNELVIWVFGASPIFGATNADSWTIPARLQHHLLKHLKRHVTVRNFGVVGYTSWQSLTALQKALMTDAPPDIVMAFNLHNDHLMAFGAPSGHCSHLMNTGVGSSAILQRSWDNLSNQQYIFFYDIISSIKQMFPSYLEISRLVWKMPTVLLNFIDPNTVKMEYRRKRDRYIDGTMGCLEEQKRAYIHNMILMSKLSQNVGATFWVGILPELGSTKKKLTGNEITERYTITNYSYALSDSDLDGLERLPNQRISQVRFADKDQYSQSLRDFKRALFAASKRDNFDALDLSVLADKMGSDIQLFSTSIHFTHEGADKLSEYIANVVIKKLESANLN